MEFFGVGPAELVLILLIVLVVFGPDQLPEVAKKLGKATRDVRNALNDINSEVNENIKPFEELKQITNLSEVPPFKATPPPPAGTSPSSNLIVADASDFAAGTGQETAASSPSPAGQASPAAPPAAPPGPDDWSV